MAIGLENYDNIDAPDSDYPNGSIRDRDGSTQGTPVNEKTYGDIHQFFAKLLRVVGFTASGLPENEYSGHQYMDALIQKIKNVVGVGSYDDWHYVGQPGEPAFTSGTWENYTTFPLQALRYRKDVNGYVHLNGHIKFSSTPYVTIFFLPPLYTPKGSGSVQYIFRSPNVFIFPSGVFDNGATNSSDFNFGTLIIQNSSGRVDIYKQGTTNYVAGDHVYIDVIFPTF